VAVNEKKPKFWIFVEFVKEILENEKKRKKKF
jgi:hypothetical protein